MGPFFHQLGDIPFGAGVLAAIPAAGQGDAALNIEVDRYMKEGLIPAAGQIRDPRRHIENIVLFHVEHYSLITLRDYEGAYLQRHSTSLSD